MKLLVDMNLSPGWVDTLAQAGFEAVHWSRLGDVKASDREIMICQGLRVSELEQGALLTIDPKRTRLRLLPLQLRK